MTIAPETAPKTATKKDTITVNNQSPHENNYWHKTRSYTYESPNDYPKTLYCEGVICGCGLGQMYGIRDFLSDPKDIKKLKKILTKVTSDYKDDGIGGFIATLGQCYSLQEKSLLKAGFIKLSTYHNWRHGDKYTQTLYLFEIK